MDRKRKGGLAPVFIKTNNGDSFAERCRGRADEDIGPYETQMPKRGRRVKEAAPYKDQWFLWEGFAAPPPVFEARYEVRVSQRLALPV